MSILFILHGSEVWVYSSIIENLIDFSTSLYFLLLFLFESLIGPYKINPKLSYFAQPTYQWALLLSIGQTIPVFLRFMNFVPIMSAGPFSPLNYRNRPFKVLIW